jgi:polysaccharide pyruvyl transferase WcaK-like protein
MDIIIIGYYDHNNLGDDQYLISFINLLKENNYNSIKFIDCDKIVDSTFNDNDIIILGGGDVLNNYFIDKITLKFKDKPNKVIAVSVGVPYTSILTETTKLDIFDHIFLRTKQDLKLFNRYYKNVSYMPDISYNIRQYPYINKNNISFTHFYKLKNIKKYKKIIGFALSRHIYHKDYINEYNNCITNLSKFVNNLIKLDYHCIFIPFNTNKISNSENDILIYNDLLPLIKNTNEITFINRKLNIYELFELYDIMDFCIPMRFHACLFSIYTKTPFLPIYSTRKIKNLLLDTKWSHSYKLETNQIDLPININSKLLLTKFNMLINSFNCTIYDFTKEYDDSIKEFNKIIIKKKDINKIILTLNNVQEFSKQHNTLDFRLIKDNNKQNAIVKIVSYCLTDGCINSKYNYGLKEKMFNKDYDYKIEWKWIINDYKKLDLVNNPKGLFNLDYIDQNDYSGTHRSGWQYVFEHIKPLHNNNAIMLDMSVDKTFHWDAEINKILKIIPYTKPWVGFVHHTFDTSFSNYNCETLLKSSDFKESLKYCKGIFVLSNDLKQKFIKNGIKNVYSFVHPTTIDVIKFKFDNFLINKNKKIVYVGGWLRNTYNFYNLELPMIKYKQICRKSTFSIHKVALKGKNMNNYYPKENLTNELYKILSNSCDNTTLIQNYSCDNSEINNNWYKHFFEDINKKISNVEIMDYIDNNSYDKLLSENIVYINLVDASAVNTLIECIVRNTPILINKIPAIVELLGEDYPLYYKNNIDVYKLLSNANNIKKAYYHIKKLPKDKYLINTFIKELTKTMSIINNDRQCV